MSQFMQSIVREVFTRNKTIVTPNQSTPTSHSPSLENIHRPNYQRQRQQERMNVDHAVRTERLVEELRSTAQSLTTTQLSQGKPGSKPQNTGKGAQLIGRTKSNQQVWYFSSPDHRLKDIPQVSTGLITGIIENPGTVFIIEEWMEQRTDIHWDWFGEKKSCGWADSIQISCTGCEDLEHILKGLYNQQNRQAIRPIKSYYVENPTDQLRRSLPMATGKSVSALVGVSKISAIALLDRYFHQSPHVSLQFEVRERFLLLSGDSQIIKDAIQKLEDDAGRLLS